MTDVIADHVSKVGPEVMSPQLAFVGLLHVIVENSKKSRYWLSLLYYRFGDRRVPGSNLHRERLQN